MTTHQKALHIMALAMNAKRYHIHVNYSPHVDGMHVTIHSAGHDYTASNPERAVFMAVVYFDETYGDDLDAVVDAVEAYASLDEGYRSGYAIGTAAIQGA